MTHHHHFALCALDTPLALWPGASAAQVRAAMEGHILGQAQLIGVYRGRLGEHSPERAR